MTDRRFIRTFLVPVGAAALVIALSSLGLTARATRMTLTPTSGEAGAVVSARGSGFPANGAGRIVFGETTVAKIRSNARGRFRATFGVPSGYEGQVEVTARVRRTRVVQVFTVSDGSATPGPTPTLTPSPTPAATASPTPSITPSPIPAPADAFARRVRTELGVFTGWLRANGVKGTIGEFGWPNDAGADQERFNLIGERYLRDMRAAGVTGSQWATGEWWGAAYRLSVYARTVAGGSVDVARPQAAVLERHTDIAGVHVNGGEFGAPSGDEPVSTTFSNVTRGSYNTAWHYDSQATFDYLASRGIREIVIPFRWERVQPVPGGDLDTAEIGRIKAAIARARAAGLTSIPMVANYGAYWLHDPLTGFGIRRAIGTAQITIGQYADLWRRLSSALALEPGIAAYGLMREPIGQPGLTTRAQAQVWEAASQAAVTAIRTNGDGRLLLVPGYRYSNAHNWPTQHPAKWITDPLNNHVYEAHHYWDSQHSGDYQAYDVEVTLSTGS